MPVLMQIHILAGAIGLLTGYAALYTKKGGGVHRGSGRYFVYSMLLMATLGMVLAVGLGKSPGVNIPAGLLTIGLIVTSLNTVRPQTAVSRRIDVAAMIALAGVGLTMTALGLRVVANGKGFGAFPYFMFGIVGLIAMAGDIRVLRSGPRTGGRRLARHLWRMSYALFIASLSFSVRLPRFLPKALQIPPVLAFPTLAVLATMAYWLWRVRAKRVARALVQISQPEAA